MPKAILFNYLHCDYLKFIPKMETIMEKYDKVNDHMYCNVQSHNCELSPFQSPQTNAYLISINSTMVKLYRNFIGKNTSGKVFINKCIPH